MSHDIQLSTDEVRRHAVAVDETASMLGEALAGAEYVRASNESYGLLVSPMILGVLNLIQDRTIDEIRHAVTATQCLADLLREMAADLDVTDAEAARRLEATDE